MQNLLVLPAGCKQVTKISSLTSWFCGCWIRGLERQVIAFNVSFFFTAGWYKSGLRLGLTWWMYLYKGGGGMYDSGRITEELVFDTCKESIFRGNSKKGI